CGLGVHSVLSCVCTRTYSRGLGRRASLPTSLLQMGKKKGPSEEGPFTNWSLDRLLLRDLELDLHGPGLGRLEALASELQHRLVHPARRADPEPGVVLAPAQAGEGGWGGVIPLADLVVGCEHVGPAAGAEDAHLSSSGGSTATRAARAHS